MKFWSKTSALRITTIFLVALAWGAAGIGVVRAEVSFNRDVRPILSDRCFACHGPDEHDRKADLRLDQSDGPDGAYRTVDGVTAIKPGSLEDSEVWYRIVTDDEDDVMPPPKAHKPLLDMEERALIREWIESGAPYEAFWAFEPPVKPSAPVVTNGDWSDQSIDRFVLRRLEEEGLKPSPEADKRSLLRRLAFDLTGLPPTPEELAAFLADEDPQAYENRVDQLLARPQYGEHMARYWLDLVRFADTNGMHKDFHRNFVAYRDWVIRAYNDNLGYDDFLRYQLAGDLFPDPNQDQLVASGFNRLHLIIDRGTALPEESYTKNVFDRVTAVGTTFLGMTVQCAMCHDHKYDPLTQKDFYALFAFFNNIDAEPETAGRPRNGLQPPTISLAGAEEKAKLAELERFLAEAEMNFNTARAAAENEADPEKNKALAQQAKAAENERNQAKKQRDQFQAQLPAAMVMKERAEVRPAYFLERGEYDKPREVVERATPAFLPPLKKETDLTSRMDLANWFVSPEHPLTARVAVNRVWQQFFGTGLVKTSEDLGAQGEVPSHPELLDHLAVSFVESGWDIRALVRQIVLSKTYRQSSSASPESFQSDPENRLLARSSRFRMDAEMIRDQILATSGLLSPKMFGPSVKPPQPPGLWKSVTMTGEVFKPDTGEDIYRRSIYTYWKRGMPPPQMTILNAPIRDSCTARRERTNTPTQALLLLNEGEYMKAAGRLAGQVLQANPDPAQGITTAYEQVTGQLPDKAELANLRQLVEDTEAHYRENPALADQLCSGAQGIDLPDAAAKARFAAWTILVNTLYNLDITKTRS